MKKVFIMVVTTLMLATANLEAGNKVAGNKNAADFKVEINMESLKRALNLKYNQVEAMEAASNQLYFGVKYAKSNDPMKQSARLNKALTNNLRMVHGVLDAKQYRDYLALLNATFINKGLDKALYYQDRAEK